MAQKRAHAIEPHFGRRLKPAEGADSSKVRRQDVLQKPAQELKGVQFDGGELAGFAFSISPQNLALGQHLDFAIGGGGFEDVTGEIAQSVFARAGCLRSHVPWMFPDWRGHLGKPGRMFLEQSLLEERAHVSPQGLVMEQKVLSRRHPRASIGTEPAAGDEVMDVGMKDERTGPGVQHAQHAQLRSQSPGIGRQIVQRLRADGEEQVQSDSQMRANEKPQFFRDGKGHQEIRHGQQQARLLAFQPAIGVGLAALRTVPVVAGMIAVFKAPAARTLIKLAAQSRGAAGADLFQDLPLPRRHGRAEALEIIRSQPFDQLMDAQALITVAGDRVHQRSPMN